jgi:hypothetical protein
MIEGFVAWRGETVGVRHRANSKVNADLRSPVSREQAEAVTGISHQKCRRKCGSISAHVNHHRVAGYVPAGNASLMARRSSAMKALGRVRPHAHAGSAVELNRGSSRAGAWPTELKR